MKIPKLNKDRWAELKLMANIYFTGKAVKGPSGKMLKLKSREDTKQLLDTYGIIGWNEVTGDPIVRCDG